MVSPGASPQLDNGYVMIANELFDALIRVRISGEQRQVLYFIIRKTYGWRKKSDAIPLSQFVEATGIRKSNVIRAINSLKLRNLITGLKKGTFDATIYGINKDYTKWLKVSKKRLVSKKRTEGLKKDNEKVSKKRHSKDTTKDTNQKKKDISAFPPKTGEKTGPPEPPKPPKKPKTPKPVEPFYLTKKKRKLKGWKLETFELFWKTFHWFKDKANAADAWLQIPELTKELALEQIIPAAARYCAGRDDLIIEKHTPKWAQGWLSSRRWEDETYGDSKDGYQLFLSRLRKTKKVV